MQNRNSGRFPFGDGVQNDGVRVVLGNGIVNQVDAVVGRFFDFLCNVWVVVLCPRYLVSAKSEARDR